MAPGTYISMRPFSSIGVIAFFRYSIRTGSKQTLMQLIHCTYMKSTVRDLKVVLSLHYYSLGTQNEESKISNALPKFPLSEIAEMQFQFKPFYLYPIFGIIEQSVYSRQTYNKIEVDTWDCVCLLLRWENVNVANETLYFPHKFVLVECASKTILLYCFRNRKIRKKTSVTISD